MLFEIALVVAGPFPSIRELLTSFGWVGWTAYVIAGLLLGILAWYLRIQFIAKRRVDQLHSKDPAERDHFLKLASEYQQKVREALKR